MRATTLFLAAALSLGSSAIDAGPNTLGFYNPNLRTASSNGTWMIVPVSAAAARAAVAPYGLTSCTTDRSVFPKGFPNGSHPILVSTQYQYDIRMAALEIDASTAASIYVPCVDRLGDGKTSFQYPAAAYIGGADGMDLMPYVPALVGSAENVPLTVAKVYPDYAAYRVTAPGEYASQVKQLIAANTLSGPGAVPAAIDMQIYDAAVNQYTSTTFHSLINQPQISPQNGMCFRNNYYFNETFAQPRFRTGRVTLYNVTSQPSQFTGRYAGVGGYSGNAVQVGYNPESCQSAAANNDKASQV